MKTLIGMVTYGNAKYTKLALDSIKEYDKFIVIGKFGDNDTVELVKNYPHIYHTKNKGFPASLNDIFDYFLSSDYDNLVLMGNDVIAYPSAIQQLETLSSEYDWVFARQISVKDLIWINPSLKSSFGENYSYKFDGSSPWEFFHPDNNSAEPEAAQLADCQNLNLYTRKAILSVGYNDVNFWPNGYFGDNDYVYRAMLAGVKSCTSKHSFYFHFWSRTIYEAERKRANNVYFERNKKYYISKWGGLPGQEKFNKPFGDGMFSIGEKTFYKWDYDFNREMEGYFLSYWSNK